MKISKKTDRLNQKGVMPKEPRSKDISWQKKIQAPRQSMRPFKPKRK